MIDFEPPLRLYLDGEALVANWRFLQEQGQAGCGAAVKADGYGLGARDVVTRLRDAGCRDFFVAHWSEAAAIADLVPADWISVLSGIEAEELPAIRDLGSVPVLNTPQQIALWKSSNGGRCHVMLDTGINRLGIGPEQVSAELLQGLNIDILMSHLVSSDEDSDRNSRQLTLFNDLSGSVGTKRRSLANSAGIMLGHDYHFDLTRPGLSLYGGIARAEMSAHIRPVVGLSARIVQTRKLRSGDTVGYNATYVCPTDMRVATIAIGYADGYLRAFSGKGSIEVNGMMLPVIGRVSMDLTTVDISASPDFAEGDWVSISYNLPEASVTSGLSQYELLTVLGRRFDRTWA